MSLNFRYEIDPYFKGQGAHAVVKIAKKKNTEEIYAVKIVRSGD